MKIEIYHPEPDYLLLQIMAGIHRKTSRHMEHWEIVSHKGVSNLTQRDLKYYFKVLLMPVLKKDKIVFIYQYHEYSDPTHYVQCEYAGKLTECILYNFGEQVTKICSIPDSELSEREDLN